MPGAYEEDEDIGLIGRLGRKLPDWIAKPLGIPAFVAAMPEMAVKGGKADWMANKEEGRRRIAAGEMVIPEDQRDPEDFSVYPSATNLNTAFSDSTAGQLADRTLGALNAPVAVAKGLGHMVSEAPGHIRGFMSGEYNTDTPEGARRAAAAAFDLGGAAAGIGAVPLTAEAAARGARAVGLLSGSARQSAPVAFGEAASKAAKPMQEGIPRFAPFEKQQPVVERKIDPVTGMYSQLEYAFDKSQMKEGTAAQWRNAFKRYGVKDAEMYWRNMDGLFGQNHPGGKISREAVQKWMDNNKVKMEARKFDDSGLTADEMRDEAHRAYVNQDVTVQRLWDRSDVDDFVDNQVKIDDNGDGTWTAETDWGDEIGVFASEEEALAATEKFAENYLEETAPLEVYDKNGDAIQTFYDGESERDAISQSRDLLRERAYEDSYEPDFVKEWADVDPIQRAENTSEYIEDRPRGGSNYTENTAFVDPMVFYRKHSSPWESGQDDIHPSYRKEGGLGWSLDEDYVDAVRGTEGRVSHEIQSPVGQAGKKQPQSVINQKRAEYEKAKAAYDEIRSNTHDVSVAELARLMTDETFASPAEREAARAEKARSGYYLDPEGYDKDAWRAVNQDLFGPADARNPATQRDPMATYKYAANELDRIDRELSSGQGIINRIKERIDDIEKRIVWAQKEGASESSLANLQDQKTYQEKKLSENLNEMGRIRDRQAVSRRQVEASRPFLSDLNTPEGDAFKRRITDANLRYNEANNAYNQSQKGVDPGPFMDDNRGLPYLMKRALIDAARDGQDWYAFSGPERMQGRWNREGVSKIYKDAQGLLRKLAREHDPNARVEQFYPTGKKEAAEMRDVTFEQAQYTPGQREMFQEEMETGLLMPGGRDRKYINSSEPSWQGGNKVFGGKITATSRPTDVVLGQARDGQPVYYLAYGDEKVDRTRPFKTRDNAETALSKIAKEFDDIEANPRAFERSLKEKWLDEYSGGDVSGGPEEAYPGVTLTPAMRDSIKKRGFSMFANQSRAALPGAFANLVDLGPSAFQALETAPSKLSRHMETPEGVAFADAQPYSVKEDHFNRSPLIESPFQEGRTQPGYGVYATEEGGLESNPMGSRFFNHPSVKDLEGQAAFDSMMLAQNEIGGIYDRPNVPGTDPLGVEDVRVGLGRRANFDEVSGLAQNLPGGAFGLIDQSGRGTGLRFIGEPGQMDTAAIMARMKELGMDPMRPESSVGSSVMPSFKNEWAQPEGSGAVTSKAFDYIDQMSPEMRARLDTPKQRMRVSQQNEMEQQIMSQLGLRGRQDLIHLRDIYFRQGMDGLKAALARGGELPSNEAIAALIPALMQDAEMSDHGA